MHSTALNSGDSTLPLTVTVLVVWVPSPRCHYTPSPPPPHTHTHTVQGLLSVLFDMHTPPPPTHTLNKSPHSFVDTQDHSFEPPPGFISFAAVTAVRRAQAGQLPKHKTPAQPPQQSIIQSMLHHNNALAGASCAAGSHHTRTPTHTLTLAVNASHNLLDSSGSW
jgi:hypothetical protein